MIIDPYGRVMEKTATFERTVLFGTITPRSDMTVFAKTGNLSARMSHNLTRADGGFPGWQANFFCEECMNSFLRTAAAIVCAAWCIGLFSASASEYPEWEGYPPMYSMNGVIGFKGMIYGATNGGIFKYNPETREYTLYYKNKGLPANYVRCVAATSDYLYFGFDTEGLIRYDPEKDRFDQIQFPEYVPNKIAVNSIYSYNDSILYVGHKYGIDILNMNTREVRSVTKLGGIEQNTPVNDVKVIKGRIWACTSNGIAVADASNPNLEVETSWKSYTYKYLYVNAWRQDGFNCVMHVDDGFEDIVYFGTNYRGMYRSMKRPEQFVENRGRPKAR